MSVIVNQGDVFLIPLDAKWYGVGVVASKWKGELYLVLFSERTVSKSAVDAPLASFTPVLASSSLDAKLWHGHWPIVGKLARLSSLMQPIYKVEERGGIVAESFDRSQRIPVSDGDAKHLHYRKTVAPIRLENALKAFHGLIPWIPAFDELRYTPSVNSHAIINVEESS